MTQSVCRTLGSLSSGVGRAGVILVVLALGLAVAAAQPLPQSPVKPSAPPAIPSPVTAADTVLEVPMGTLGPSQTISQVLAFRPGPAKGFMNVSGTWGLVCAGMGCEGRINIKLNATLTSPSGRRVVDGCGYARNAGPPFPNASVTTYQPRLSGTGFWSELLSPELPRQWTLTVRACSENPTNMAIPNVRMRIAYKAGPAVVR